MTHFIDALKTTIENDLRYLHTLEERLTDATPSQIPAVVRSVAECCDSLSSGLAKLARNTDTVAEEKPRHPSKPVHDPRPLIIAARVQSLIENGPCACGNVIPPDAAPAEAEPTWRAANRARRASE